jgi:hypothetical protein
VHACYDDFFFTVGVACVDFVANSLPCIAGKGGWCIGVGCTVSALHEQGCCRLKIFEQIFFLVWVVLFVVGGVFVIFGEFLVDDPVLFWKYCEV